MHKMKLILAITAIFSSHIALAETTVINKYNDYPISGKSMKEISKSMQKHGLKDKQGNHFAAETTPQFTWKYNFSESATECSIKSADVEVEITYKMPELVNYDSLNKKTKDEWKKYYNATKKHEDGHVKIIKAAAETLEQQLAKLPAKASCGDMARFANLEALKILQDQDSANLNYDSATNHGAVQGAILVAAK